MDYNFVSRVRFEQMIAAGEFLEWADVFGNFYGTAATDTARCMETGDDVVLVIDVQGARKVRGRALAHVGIFVLPPSFETLEQRLRGRSKDSDEAISRRLQVARDEVSAFEEYDYVVINEEFESCVQRLRSMKVKIMAGRPLSCALSGMKGEKASNLTSTGSWSSS